MNRIFIKAVTLSLLWGAALMNINASGAPKARKGQPMLIQEPDFTFLHPAGFYEKNANGSVTFIKTPGGVNTHSEVKFNRECKYGVLEFELDPADFKMVPPMTFQVIGQARFEDYTAQILIQIPDARNKGISINPQQFNNFPGAVVGPKLHPGLTLERLGKATSVKIVITKGETKGKLDIYIYLNNKLVAEDCGRLADPWQADSAMPGFKYVIGLYGNTVKLKETGRLCIKSVKFTPGK